MLVSQELLCSIIHPHWAKWFYYLYEQRGDDSLFTHAQDGTGPFTRLLCGKYRIFFMLNIIQCYVEWIEKYNKEQCIYQRTLLVPPVDYKI